MMTETKTNTFWYITHIAGHNGILFQLFSRCGSLADTQIVSPVTSSQKVKSTFRITLLVIYFHYRSIRFHISYASLGWVPCPLGCGWEGVWCVACRRKCKQQRGSVHTGGRILKTASRRKIQAFQSIASHVEIGRKQGDAT